MTSIPESLPTRFGGKRVSWLVQVLAKSKTQPVEVECASRKEADNLRWSFYHHKPKIEDGENIKIQVKGCIVKLSYTPTPRIILR